MINARAEFLTEKPAFKHLVGSRRCIIPADGFYVAQRKQEQGHNVGPSENSGAFPVAGLWDVWGKPDGKQVESVTMITTDPNELVRPVNKRIPVIHRPEDE